MKILCRQEPQRIKKESESVLFSMFSIFFQSRTPLLLCSPSPRSPWQVTKSLIIRPINSKSTQNGSSFHLECNNHTVLSAEIAADWSMEDYTNIILSPRIRSYNKIANLEDILVQNHHPSTEQGEIQNIPNISFNISKSSRDADANIA